jgi:RNAse (barnase) inhibitor barstar
MTVLKQVVDLIPAYLVPKLARKHGVDKKSRSFTPWSHVVSLVHAQLAHSLSLNDVCDDLRSHSGALSTLRGATPPSRNGLSHASRNRNADMAEELFWKTLGHLQSQAPAFGMGRKYVGFPRRFKRVINVVDSTTIKLVANCMDWAKHRRRKAAAKCHMRLDLQTFLPRFALVKSANTHDSTEAVELCADIRAGEVVVFDKAYVDFAHLHSLSERDVFWVTRAKDNMAYEIVGQRTAPSGPILLDATIRLTVDKSRRDYPDLMRLIVAVVEIDGKETVMTFLTNNLEWAPSSICDLYKARWGIEVFFKQIKQTLQLADFLGHNEDAIRWQVWTALLTYVLLRFIAFRSGWTRSFSRLFTVLRAVLWDRLNMYSVLAFCGTAPGSPPLHATPGQAYLPGFAP